MKRVGAALVALTICGCATPQSVRPTIDSDAVKTEAMAEKRFVIDQRLSESRRVDEVHRRLSAANLEFCKVRARSIGAEIYALRQYGKTFRDAAAAIGLTDAPTIAYVLADSPAAQAGLQAGDVITAIDSKAVAQSSSGARDVEKTIAEWPAGKVIPIHVQRAGAQMDFSITPQELCGYPIQVAESDELNAFATGKSIVLNRRLLSVVQDDNQLALVIGHEMAHNALGHLSAQQKNQALGMAGGLLIDVLIAATTGYAGSDFTRMGGQVGAAAYSSDFEAEADYVGMYFVARAGYSLDNIENIWRRFAAEYPKGITLGGDHPTTPKRYVAIAAARDEIRKLQAAGLPLKPHMKGDGTIDTASAAAAKTTPAPPSAPSAPTPTPPATPAPPAPAPTATPVALSPSGTP